MVMLTGRHKRLDDERTHEQQLVENVFSQRCFAVVLVVVV